MTRRGRKKKDVLRWWIDRINELKGVEPSAEEVYRELKERIPRLDSIIRASPWSGIKLTILAYYLGIYSVAIKGYRGRTCYVDTFAGPGLRLLTSGTEGEQHTVIYGSPALAILLPRMSTSRKEFGNFIFVENDTENSYILEESVKILINRVGLERENVLIHKEDMNDIDYNGLLKKYRCKHGLVFVDPECCEPRWSTVENILRQPVDVLLNFMISGIRRIWGRMKEQQIEARMLDEFFGTDEWRNASSEKDLLNTYLNQIRKTGRVVETIRVNGGDMFYYYIILAVRRTSRDNPWLDAVRNRLKPNVEKTDAKTFVRLIDILEGRQKTLSSYDLG